MPKISVLMSAYNSEKYISETIESVLSQTFTNFEFIIINDGSTDNTENIIRNFDDARIKYYHQENQGVSKSLNKGLQIATGKYIAKIDSDDLCYPNRLELQYKFMEENPDYVVCGSYTDVIDENGMYIYTYKNISTTNENIQMEMPKKNSIIHSSSFYSLEKALLVGGYYEPIRQYFEDYMFFSQLIKTGKAYNFDVSLIKYRITPGAISSRTKNKRYIKLVHDVINRGFITEEEKFFLFSHKLKKSEKNLQFSNDYLTVSRLYFKYQRDFRKTVYYFQKGVRAKVLNPNVLLSLIYIIYCFIFNKKSN